MKTALSGPGWARGGGIVLACALGAAACSPARVMPRATAAADGGATRDAARTGPAPGAVDAGAPRPVDAAPPPPAPPPPAVEMPPPPPPPPILPPPPDAAPQAPVGAASLDDLEDCDGAILPNDGRAGSWYQYVDTFGSALAPAAFKPEAAGSPVSPKCAVHVKGMTVNRPDMMQFGYAGVGFSFPGNMSIDSSAYDGITFFARGSGQIRVAITLPATTEVALGGTCLNNCGDSFGFVVDLTADWQRFAVPWTALTQDGWGTPATFEQSKMTGIDFGFSSGWVFDAFIDDVGYLLPGAR